VASSWRVAAATGERKRMEKRSTFDLEPPIAGHRSFPETLWRARRFALLPTVRVLSPLRVCTYRSSFMDA
jgi:hypothetical protein